MMKLFDYLIIGGGIAGTTAAETIRHYDKSGSIALVSDEPYRLYSRVLLPHFVKGSIREERLFLKGEQFYIEQGIEFLFPRRVSRLTTQREVIFENGETVSFKKLLVASGGRPRKWELDENLRGVARLQTLSDALELKELLPDAKRAVIVGGGFIGLDFANILAHFRIPTVLLLRNEGYWHDTLSEEEGRLVHERLGRHGIEVHPKDDVESLIGDDRLVAVRTKRGETFFCELLGLGIGLIPNIEFLEGSGVELGKRGIKTNEYLETSMPCVFAAGDAVEFFNLNLGRHHQLGSWTNAVQQGRVAASNMTGLTIPMTGVSSYTAIPFPDLTITFLGEVKAKALRDTEVKRYDMVSGALGRVFLKDGKIIGAVLINRPGDVGPLFKLIETKKEVGPNLGHLSDPAFNLRWLL